MQTMLRRGRPRPRRAVWSCASEGHGRSWMPSVAVQALDQLSTGIILTDDGAEVVEINRAGESIVQLEDGLLIRNDRLCARRVFETGKILKLIAGATTEGRSSATAERMLIGRRDGLPAYVLSVSPWCTGLVVDKRRLAMVIVVDPSQRSPPEKDLGEFFGLTPAEARLGVLLLTGKTLADIALNTGVRITTVRTQLRSVLRKVGAKRQSELIRILSSTGFGSASLSAGWPEIAAAVGQLSMSLA